MATTEVILTHNLPGLGAESDKLKVKAGYARNYLLPKGLAIPVTESNERRLTALRKRRMERESHELSSMKELAASLARIVLKIIVKTGDDGRMFGSVTAGSIVEELKNQWDVLLDRKKIHLDSPLRTLGDHEVELRLHPKVEANLKVKIESSTPLPEPQPEAKPAPEESDRKAASPETGRRSGRPRR